MLDDLTNTDTFKAFASLITGGALVAYIRERRKGKKDAYTFAMDLLTQQSLRIDGLVSELAEVKAMLKVEAGAVAILREENEKLRVENTRLKTALGEHGRHVA